MEPFLGQIVLFGGNFAPRGWAKCEGQLLSIASNSALFSILGTIYGGDGRTTFGLPDLRGRAPIGVGNGPGLSNYSEGNRGGQEAVTLTATQIPAHSHSLNANLSVSSNVGNQRSPIGARLAVPNDGENNYTTSSGGNGTMAVSGSTSGAGGGQAHENRQPYIAMNYIIALVGTFPSRS